MKEYNFLKDTWVDLDTEKCPKCQHLLIVPFKYSWWRNMMRWKCMECKYKWYRPLVINR